MKFTNFNSCEILGIAIFPKISSRRNLKKEKLVTKINSLNVPRKMFKAVLEPQKEIVSAKRDNPIKSSEIPVLKYVSRSIRNLPDKS